MKRLQILVLACALFTCKGSSSSNDQTSDSTILASAAETYFQKSSTIDLEVWYQSGAEPYVGKGALGNDLWQILNGNLTAIFQYRSTQPTINIPNELSEMHALSAASQESWSSDQILEIWKANQVGSVPDGTSRFYIYFFDGYFQEDGEVNKNVLGVQIGANPVIAIFKPVIAASSQGGLVIPKYMEQSTLVHEMGHALGFVNHGVPMVSDYQDVEHGAHSTDEDCVMYWLNEGASDLLKVAKKLAANEGVVLWGQNVLDDAKAFSK